MMRRRFFDYRTYQGNPFGLDLRGNGTLYVGELGSNKITLVNKLDQGVVNVIQTQGNSIFDIKIDEAGGHYYYCVQEGNTISKMTLDTNTLVETKSFATAIIAGFDIDYVGNRIFVCNQYVGSIFVHDFTSNALIATINTVYGSQRVIYDSARNRLIVCYLDGYIRAFDATTYALDETIAVSVGNYLRGMVADYANNQLFISNTTLTEIYVYNLDLLTYKNELYQTTGPVYGMAVDNTSNLLFYGDDGVITNIPLGINIANAVYVFDGNSLTAGQGGTPYPTQFEALAPFAGNGTFNNLGVGGQQTSQMIADFNSQVLPLYNAARTCFYLVNEVGNDIYYNGDVTAAMSIYWQLCDAARNAGFKVGAIGLEDRSISFYGTTTVFGDSDAAYREKLAQADGLIRSNWQSHADFYVDLIAATELSDCYDATYFYDRVHNTTAGYAVWAREVRLSLLAYCNIIP